MAKEILTKISIYKRIQEIQFEPFEIILESTVKLSSKDKGSIIRKKYYKKLEKEMDLLIEKRLKRMED